MGRRKTNCPESRRANVLSAVQQSACISLTYVLERGAQITCVPNLIAEHAAKMRASSYRAVKRPLSPSRAHPQRRPIRGRQAAHAHGNDVSSDTAGIVDPLRNRAKCTTELAMRSGTMRMGATPPNVMPFSPSGRTPTNFLPARMPRVPPWPLLVNSLPVGVSSSAWFDRSGSTKLRSSSTATCCGLARWVRS
jgi:hypothetical protein